MVWLDGGYGFATGLSLVTNMDAGPGPYFVHGPAFGALLGVARTGAGFRPIGVGYDVSFLMVIEDRQRLIMHRHSLAVVTRWGPLSVRGGVGLLLTGELYCHDPCPPGAQDCSATCLDNYGISVFVTPTLKIPVDPGFAFQLSVPLSLAGLVGLDFSASLRVGVAYY